MHGEGFKEIVSLALYGVEWCRFVTVSVRVGVGIIVVFTNSLALDGVVWR